MKIRYPIACLALAVAACGNSDTNDKASVPSQRADEGRVENIPSLAAAMEEIESTDGSELTAEDTSAGNIDPFRRWDWGVRNGRIEAAREERARAAGVDWPTYAEQLVEDAEAAVETYDELAPVWQEARDGVFCAASIAVWAEQGQITPVEGASGANAWLEPYWERVVWWEDRRDVLALTASDDPYPAPANLYALYPLVKDALKNEEIGFVAVRDTLNSPSDLDSLEAYATWCLENQPEPVERETP